MAEQSHRRAGETRLQRLVRQKITERIDLARRYATANQRVLPNAFIIGAQKAGTTSLYNYLIQHPAFLPVRKKEIHYFDRKYHLGEKFYRAHFPTRNETEQASRETGEPVVTCDPTPCSMVHPLAMERIARLVPGARLVAVLRNPVERTFSSYRHQLRRGRETLSFRDALDAEEKRLKAEVNATPEGKDSFGYNHQHFGYLLRSRYAEQLERVFEYFPREQVLVVPFEELVSEPKACTNRVFEFLGLTSLEEGQFAPLNQGIPSDWDADIRAELCDYFRPHNDALYELLGECFDWA